MEAKRDILGYRVQDHEERITKLEETQVELRDTLRDIQHTLYWGRRVSVGLIALFGPTILAVALKYLGA